MHQQAWVKQGTGHGGARRLVALGAIGLCLALGMAGPAAAAPVRAVTEPEMQEIARAALPMVLDRAGLAGAPVARVFVAVRTETDWDIVTGARTWVWFADRTGALVYQQTAGGYVQQIYTTEGLSLPGLPAW